MTSSSISSPRSMRSFTARPRGVGASAVRLSMSPVAMTGTPLACAMRAACVPFPDPGGPMRTRFTDGTLMGAEHLVKRAQKGTETALVY